MSTSTWFEPGPSRIRRSGARAVTEIDRLLDLLGMSTLSQLQKERAAWAEEEMRAGRPRSAIWSDRIAVGSEEFVAEVKARLAMPGFYRTLTVNRGTCTLGESKRAYRPHFDAEMGPLSLS